MRYGGTQLNEDHRPPRSCSTTDLWFESMTYVSTSSATVGSQYRKAVFR